MKDALNDIYSRDDGPITVRKKVRARGRSSNRPIISSIRVDGRNATGVTSSVITGRQANRHTSIRQMNLK